MKLAYVLSSALALAACVPTMEMREGPERERLVGLVRQFCAAERSADPFDSHRLFVDPMRDMLARSRNYGEGGRPLTSGDAKAACEPGRTWYLGGSRMFAEVRFADHSDRLDSWRSAGPEIGNVLYGRKRRVGGRSFSSLKAELIAEHGSEPPPAPSPPDTSCLLPGYHFAFVGMDTTVYRQGSVVRLTPMVDRSPAGTDEIPLKCTSGWAVTGPAVLAADRKSLTNAPDAPAGSLVHVRFYHSGKPISAQFRVVSKDEIVLTGRYTQRSLEGCHASEPVGELEFRPDKRFSVTFVPFETYQDYWGTYAWDPDTGRLRLTVEGGNFVPPNLDLEGAAELKDGRLRLTDMFLGSRDGAPRPGCTYLF
ncbi:MAG TPA: hypothetical protein VF535_12805 [Allosphingosinicella sp.]|jgi:hypothetical protein